MQYSWIVHIAIWHWLDQYFWHWFKKNTGSVTCPLWLQRMRNQVPQLPTSMSWFVGKVTGCNNKTVKEALARQIGLDLNGPQNPLLQPVGSVWFQTKVFISDWNLYQSLRSFLRNQFTLLGFLKVVQKSKRKYKVFREKCWGQLCSSVFLFLDSLKENSKPSFPTAVSWIIKSSFVKSHFLVINQNHDHGCHCLHPLKHHWNHLHHCYHDDGDRI